MKSGSDLCRYGEESIQDQEHEAEITYGVQRLAQRTTQSDLYEQGIMY